MLENTYDNMGIRFPKIEAGELIDIDPFTIFGMFNKRITDKNRVAICQAFKHVFDLVSDIPDDFVGIPVSNNLETTF